MFYKLVSGVLLIAVFTMVVSAQDASGRARLAFERDGSLYVLEPASETPILIEELPSDDYGAVWSPDGTMLAYTVLGDHPINPVENLKVWDGTQVFEIAAAEVNRTMPINWTQDGRLLYFGFQPNPTSELAIVYTINPTADARPQQISDEVPLCVDYNQAGTLVQLIEQGLVYTSGCVEYTGNEYTGYDGVIYQPPTRSTVTFGYGLTETRLLSQDQNELLGVVYGLKGDTSVVRVDLTTMEEMLERPLVKYLDNQSLYLNLALDNDGTVYYDVGRDTYDLLDTLSEEQLTTFSRPLRAYANLIGVYPDYLIYPNGRLSAFPHNTVGIARMDAKGRSKYLVEKMDFYSVERMQVVGQTLYFSVINNNDQWLQDLLDGTLEINPDESVESLEFTLKPYIETDLYAVDLTVKRPVPVLILEDAHQFVAGGQ